MSAALALALATAPRPFVWTDKQQEAMWLLASASTYCMLFGGGRSGKTFLIVRSLVHRALKAPDSRHLILRFRYNHVVSSIILDTFPKVMRLCYPEVDFKIHMTHGYVKFPNGSEIWFGGLDDKERMEKILGTEFVTIFLNECSQISYEGYQLVITRLAQLVMQSVTRQDGTVITVPMKTRLYADENPPNKAHWTYRLFKQKVDPDKKEPLLAPDDYCSLLMNPKDNIDNLNPEYLRLLSGMSERMKRRFERGEFSDATPNALFKETDIDKWRASDGESLPDFVRVVVACDPSGSGDDENADNDEIGIGIVALGTDGNAYVLEDATIKAGPATWGRVTVQSWQRHSADAIVGEVNFGGEMVRTTILAAARDLDINVKIPFKKVTASRGKIQRAEPFSALYEQGKVRHVGIFAKLEDELCAFTTNGYSVAGSPNRADAVIWALAELFPSMVARPKKEKQKRKARSFVGRLGWMGS